MTMVTIKSFNNWFKFEGKGKTTNLFPEKTNEWKFKILKIFKYNLKQLKKLRIRRKKNFKLNFKLNFTQFYSLK